MPIAAVPNYLGDDFRSASPGLRFGLLLKLWGVNRNTGEILWTQEDIDYEQRGHGLQEKKINNTYCAISEVCRYTTQDNGVMQALLTRQRAAFTARGDAAVGLTIQAQAVAPFTTGLGNEHPLENGFAFLNPYGLPYLPGSGVKGVLRRAAQELASGEWGDTRGWSKQHWYQIEVGTADERRTIDLSLIDVLFGRETQEHDKDHVRGALTFWDVIPQIQGDGLMVEVMTPHQSHYYQQRNDPLNGESATPPHDSGQPNPIFFLTVPPGSRFTFHVVCDSEHLRRLTNTKLDGAPDLLSGDQNGNPYWKTLITAAFGHAFQWLGFGAKTAVGYGAMKTDNAAASANGATPGNAHHAQQQAGVHRGGASLPTQEEVWQRATLRYNPGDGMVTVEYGQQRTAPCRLNQVKGLTDQHSARLQRRRTITATVVVKRSGNTIELHQVKEVV